MKGMLGSCGVHTVPARNLTNRRCHTMIGMDARISADNREPIAESRGAAGD